MKNQFIRLSSLRIEAQKSVEEHVARWDDKKRVLNAILGGAATNREWLEEAQRKYAGAQSSTGFTRITLLAGALYEIYRCHYRMQHSRFDDETVHTLRQKYETAYLNAALNYIEDHINDDEKAARNRETLQQAIGLLSEENSRMARAYQQRLEQHRALGDARQRLHDLLDTPPDALDLKHVMQIRALLHLHEPILKSDAAVWEQLLSHLASLMEGTYALHRDKLQWEQNKPQPSLRAMTDILDSFASLYNPLKQYAHSRRYQAFLDERERWAETLRFLDEDYPALKKMYDWLSLPRDRVDERKLMSLYEKLSGFRRHTGEPWFETRNLDPDLDTIAERIERALENHHRRDFIDIMRQYNHLLNAPEGVERTREIGRFLGFLGARLDDNRLGAYGRERIAALRSEVASELDVSLQRLLDGGLSAAGDESSLITAFDAVIDLAMELHDVDRVSALQRRKRAAIEKLRAGASVAQAIREDAPSPTEPAPESDSVAPGRLVILDNYSLRNYVLFTKPRITLGRDDDNDIILLSRFISARHAAIDFVRGVLSDLASTNGTFTGGQKSIEEQSLRDTAWFDLANSMVFTVHKLDGGWSFALQKIQDRELLDDPERRSYNQSLLNTAFVWLDDGASLRIHKVSGHINDATGADTEQIVVTRTGDSFAFTDAARNLRGQSLDEARDNLSDRFSFNLL